MNAKVKELINELIIVCDGLTDDEINELLQEIRAILKKDIVTNAKAKRIHDIEYALNEEPVSPEMANELLNELAELTIKDGVSNQKWFDAQKEIPLP